MGRIVIAVQLKDLPISSGCMRRLMMLRNNGRYQLVCKLKRTPGGEVQVLVWRFESHLKLSERARLSVPDLLKPTLILSELDVYPISEDHVYEEPEEEGLTPWDVAPAREFDSDVFYQQI
jgi:hypothetical protein